MKSVIHAVIQFFFAALIEDWQKKPPKKKLIAAGSLFLFSFMFGFSALIAFAPPTCVPWIIAVSCAIWCAVSIFACWRLSKNFGYAKDFYGEAQDKQYDPQPGFHLEDEYPPPPKF